MISSYLLAKLNPTKLKYIALKEPFFSIVLRFDNFLVLFLFFGTAKKKILKKDSSKNENIFGKTISKNKLKSKKKQKKKNE
jgi:hypothetical protein